MWSTGRVPKETLSWSFPHKGDAADARQKRELAGRWEDQMRIEELISIKLFAEVKMKEESIDTRSLSPLNAYCLPTPNQAPSTISKIKKKKAMKSNVKRKS